MDSLTQIVLGAAAGEAVLGKKIGNRAMVWGAVGGTIPDMDVLGKFFLSEIENLQIHRAFSHSILFSIVGAIIFGFLVHSIYKSKHHKWIAMTFRLLAAILVGFASDFVLDIFFPNTIIPITLAIICITGILLFTVRRRYLNNSWERPNANLRDWQWLFFLTLFTHPILDCFTMYGTQLFAPFSNYKVAWSSISVVDPVYTAPFLLCLILAGRLRRESNMRRFWNYLGIGISTTYLLFTLVNKQIINSVFEEAIAEQNMKVERFISNPLILNNIVWNCTAEGEDTYYMAQYSHFDEVPVQFNRIEKNHHLLNNIDTDPTIGVLRWFSNDYFSVFDHGDTLQFNDLRFGSFSGKGEGPNDFIFRFMLTDENGQYEMHETVAGPPDRSANNMLKSLWERIWGIKEN